MKKLDTLRSYSKIVKSLLFSALLCNSIDANAQLKDSTGQYYRRLYRGFLLEDVVCLYGHDIKSINIYAFDPVEVWDKAEVVLSKRKAFALKRRKIILIFRPDDSVDLEWIYKLNNVDIIGLFKGRIEYCQYKNFKDNEIKVPEGK